MLDMSSLFRAYFGSEFGFLLMTLSSASVAVASTKERRRDPPGRVTQDWESIGIRSEPLRPSAPAIPPASPLRQDRAPRGTTFPLPVGAVTIIG